MKYVRTNDGRIVTSFVATHELTESICCVGYLRTLKKGSLCKIGKTWQNYYGSWTSIIDENGTSYDIRPNEVKNVVKELPSANTIEELCDYEMHYDNDGEFVIRPIRHIDWASLKRVIINKRFKDCKLAIKTDKGLIYVARMNETNGDIELL